MSERRPRPVGSCFKKTRGGKEDVYDASLSRGPVRKCARGAVLRPAVTSGKNEAHMRGPEEAASQGEEAQEAQRRLEEAEEAEGGLEEADRAAWAARGGRGSPRRPEEAQEEAEEAQEALARRPRRPGGRRPRRPRRPKEEEAREARGAPRRLTGPPGLRKAAEKALQRDGNQKRGGQEAGGGPRRPRRPAAA